GQSNRRYLHATTDNQRRHFGSVLASPDLPLEEAVHLSQHSLCYSFLAVDHSRHLLPHTSSSAPSSNASYLSRKRRKSRLSVCPVGVRNSKSVKRVVAKRRHASCPSTTAAACSLGCKGRMEVYPLTIALARGTSSASVKQDRKSVV